MAGINSKNMDKKEVPKPKKAKCYNCKFAGEQFKVGDKTYLHCHNEVLYPTADFGNGKLSAWDTLMDWWATCTSHEFRINK